jgi:hypothetical protein
MLTIPINELTPKGALLTGSLIGEEHARQIAQRIRDQLPAGGVVALDFTGINNVSASYLKRLLGPLLAHDGRTEDPLAAVMPVVVNAGSDLVEELEDYLEGKCAVLQMAAEKDGTIRLHRLLGELDGAAAETFGELRKRGKVTAQELFEAQPPNRTSNQTAWNNRLAQLVELKIANRHRTGRVWIYHTTINN